MEKSYKGLMYFWKSLLNRGTRIFASSFLLVALIVQASGAQTPDDEALTVWLPEGARIEQRLVLPHNIVTRVIAPAAPKQVLEFYTQRFKEEGWELVSTFELEGSYTVFAIQGRRDATLTIAPGNNGGSRIRASVSRTEWQRIEPQESPQR